MQTHQLEEAKRYARQFAESGDQSWYVIQVGDVYQVVPKSQLDKLPGHAHQVVYGCTPGQQEAA